MPLSKGDRLGPYEILALVGRGGMGEVYRAHDNRLLRDVALKVASTQFDTRFEREARAIAQLNHPHICTLHDLGPDYLVMELVEGETLANRLKKGALPIEQAIRYGAQIADALAAAHARGITHRDLKPGNVMVTRTGIKVLDFGLAKMAGEETLTIANAVMGTPAYMAPEQREGKSCDARTDIYALGLILFEMVTGKRYSPSDLPATLVTLPERFSHVLEKALAPAPDLRWQTASDVRTELEWAAAQPARATSQVMESRKTLAWAIAATALAAALAGMFWVRRTAIAPLTARFTFQMPESTTQRRGTGETAVSPDGSRIAVVSEFEGGSAWLWIRNLDSEEMRKVEGSEGASGPFWSPDGQHLAFFADGKLKRAPADGGPLQNICNSAPGLGAAWSPSGDIVFNPTNRAPLMRVPAAGGAPAPLTRLNDALQENSHRWPSFLPDGRHFLFTARSSLRENTAVYIGSLDSKEVKRVLTEQSQAIYAAEYLLFGREGNLMAQRFDLDKLQVSGKPLPVAGNIDHAPTSANSFFTASVDGRVLAYHLASSTATQMMWFDRQGSVIERVGPVGGSMGSSLSPDGRKLVLTQADSNTGNRDLWMMELGSGTLTRFTSNPANDWQPVWSPDGEWIAFASDRTPQSSIWRKRVNGNSVEEMIVPPSASGGAFPKSWSPDGQTLAYVDKGDIWFAAIAASSKTKAWFTSDFLEASPQFSPDGKWVAYTSNETGAREVYVRALVGARAYRISVTGGDVPRWRANGKEIYFMAADRRLMAVGITVGETVRVTTPKPLFLRCPSEYLDFSVSASGERFIMSCPTATSKRAVTVLLDWQSTVKFRQE